MMTEDEWAHAVNIMADEMEKGARFIGYNNTEISGDRHILAERALRALVKRFDVRGKS